MSNHMCILTGEYKNKLRHNFLSKRQISGLYHNAREEIKVRGIRAQNMRI